MADNGQRFIHVMLFRLVLAQDKNARFAKTSHVRVVLPQAGAPISTAILPVYARFERVIDYPYKYLDELLDLARLAGIVCVSLQELDTLIYQPLFNALLPCSYASLSRPEPGR